MDEIQLEDSVQVIEEKKGPLELPEGLTAKAVEDKAISWNSAWKPLFDRKKSQWEHNYQLFRHFDKFLVENTSQRTYEVWANIQSEIPHLVNSIFTKSEVVKGFPKFEDIDNKSFKVNHYVNKMILIGNQGRKIAADAIQDFLVFGNVISKTFWDNEEKSDFDINTQKWVDTYEGKPSVYNLDIFNFAIDPTFVGHDINKAQWARERIFYKKEEIIEMMERGEIEEIPLELLDSVSTSGESGEDIRNNIDGVNVKKDKIFIDEFWAQMYWKTPDGEQKTGKYTFWILGGKLVKFKRNIFNSSPFKISRCYRLAHEFFGVGDCDVMASLSENINLTHSQGSILAKKVGQKLTILGPNAGIDAQQLKSKEQGVITVKDMSQIKTENTTAGADLGTLINYKLSLKQDLANAVGINDIMKGESQGDMTAAEASILNSNASARLAMKLANFQDEWLVPVATSFYSLSKQFITNYSFFIENQLIQLSQQDFQGDYDWTAQGTTALANRNLRMKQMIEIGSQLANASQLAAQSNGRIKFPPFDLGKFAQNEILSLAEIQNPMQYMLPEDTLPIQVPLPIEGSNGSEGLPQQLPIRENPVDDAGNLGIDEGGAASVTN